MKIHKNHQYQIWGLILLSAFCGGSVAVLGKFALEGMRPFTLTFIRFFCAIIFLYPIVHHKKEVSIKHLRQFFLIALLGALNPILLFVALQFTTASTSPFIYAGVPAISALYAFFYEKSIPTSKQMVGIFLGLIGVSIIVLLPLFERHMVNGMIKGNILIVISMLCFTLYGIKSKKAQVYSNASSISLVFYFCIVAFLISIPFSISEVLTYGLNNIQTKHLFSAALTGFMGTGLNYMSYQHVLRKSSAVVASTFTFIQPVVVISLASLLLHETVTGTLIFGGTLAITGALLASFHKKNYENSPAS